MGGGWRQAERRQNVGSEAFCFMRCLLLNPLTSAAFSFSIALCFISSILNEKLTGLGDHLSFLCLRSSRTEGRWSYNPPAPINIGSRFFFPRKVGSRRLKVLYSVLGYLTYLLTRVQSESLFADGMLFI